MKHICKRIGGQEEEEEEEVGGGRMGGREAVGGLKQKTR